MQKHKIYSKTGYKYRLKISKTSHLKFISHLDWQKLIYTAVRKSGLKINYSQGFNPAPKISIGIALPLFIQGKNEYIDIELQEEVADNIIKDKLNHILPKTSQISGIVKIPKDKPSIEKEVCWAVYTAIAQDEEIIKNFNIETIAKEFLLKQNIVVNKHTKKGIKKVDIRPGVYSLNFDTENKILNFTLKAGIGDIKDPLVREQPLMDEKVCVSSLRADQFLKVLTPQISWRITREKLLGRDFNELCPTSTK